MLQFSGFNIILIFKIAFIILLEELKVYQLAMEISELVFNITLKWDFFKKEFRRQVPESSRFNSCYTVTLKA